MRWDPAAEEPKVGGYSVVVVIGPDAGMRFTIDAAQSVADARRPERGVPSAPHRQAGVSAARVARCDAARRSTDGSPFEQRHLRGGHHRLRRASFRTARTSASAIRRSASTPIAAPSAHQPAAYRFWAGRRRQPGDASSLSALPPPCRRRRPRRDRRRDGDRKRAARRSPPRARSARERPFHRLRLHRRTAEPGRIGALRPRARRVHRSRGDAQRGLRAGSRRHVAHRRSGRSGGLPPTEAAPSHRALGNPARRGDKFVRVDVRVLAATRRDLDREVQEGRFRDDLFHRLAVARIELPSARPRGDVALLGRYFWAGARRR